MSANNDKTAGSQPDLRFGAAVMVALLVILVGLMVAAVTIAV